MTLLAPPKIIEVTGPVVFLGGPIQGSNDWQSHAIDMVEFIRPGTHVANPRRAYLDELFALEDQVDWETVHLSRSAEDGVIVFWLQAEDDHACDRSYAQTTRFELAEWRSIYLMAREAAKIRPTMASPPKIAVGMEEGFTGGPYIRHRFITECPELNIWPTLQATINHALYLLDS